MFVPGHDLFMKARKGKFLTFALFSPTDASCCIDTPQLSKCQLINRSQLIRAAVKDTLSI